MDSFARFMNRIINKMKQIISNNKGDDLMKRSWNENSLIYQKLFISIS